MNLNLYIAEKPSLAKTIAAELGNPKQKDGYIETDQGNVTWCIGHMYENFSPAQYSEKYAKWKMEDLPIIPDEFKLCLKESRSDQVNIINDLIEDSDQIINCGDCDREGQLLVDEVIENSNFQGKVKRAWPKDLSKTGLEKMLSNLEDNIKYKPLSDSAKARSHLDWLTGINLTRTYTILAQSRGLNIVLSVGRVQTPTLNLVVERDLEIENFKSIEFYEIMGKFEFEGIEFECKKVLDDEKKDENKRCIDKEYVEKETKRLQEVMVFNVLSIENKEKKENAPLPFSLGDLQIHCSKEIGMSGKEVLEITQSLYASHKVTTYPRTNCNYLSEGDFQECVKTISLIGKEHLEILNIDKMPRCFNDKKVTAHTAIVPNGSVPKNLKGDEQKVYEIISKRFIAQFANPYKYSETIIILENEDDRYKTKGKVEIDNGYKKLLNNKEPKKQAQSQRLPNLKNNDQVKHLGSSIISKKTTSPKKHTDGTLLAGMINISKRLSNQDEKEILAKTEGIGEESTRADIIEGLKDREYLLSEKKHIISTLKARNFISLMIEEIKSPVLTAQWEKSLSQIEQGKLSYEEFIQEQKQWINEICDKAKNSDLSKFGGKSCPKCDKGYQTIKKGKKTAFIGCTLYPECDFTIFPKSKNKFKKSKIRRKK